jgi:hypothetical protein
MTTCKDCKFYEPISESKGNCFGYEVPADMPIEKCPTRSFRPKFNDFLRGSDSQDISPQ